MLQQLRLIDQLFGVADDEAKATRPMLLRSEGSAMGDLKYRPDGGFARQWIRFHCQDLNKVVRDARWVAASRLFYTLHVETNRSPGVLKSPSHSRTGCRTRRRLPVVTPTLLRSSKASSTLTVAFPPEPDGVELVRGGP